LRKIEILVRTKCWSKIEILVKNWNFAERSYLLSIFEKIETKNRNFGQKFKLWTRIEIFVKNRNFGQKSKFWSNLNLRIRVFIDISWRWP